MFGPSSRIDALLFISLDKWQEKKLVPSQMQLNPAPRGFPCEFAEGSCAERNTAAASSSRVRYYFERQKLQIDGKNGFNDALMPARRRSRNGRDARREITINGGLQRSAIPSEIRTWEKVSGKSFQLESHD